MTLESGSNPPRAPGRPGGQFPTQCLTCGPFSGSGHDKRRRRRGTVEAGVPAYGDIASFSSLDDPALITLAIHDGETLKMYTRFLLPTLFSLFLFPGSSGAQTTSDIQVQKHFQAAQQAEKARNYQKAAAEFQAVLKLRPELAEVYNNLGLVYYLQGKNDAAIKTFQQALERKPDILGANLFLGMAYIRTNQYEKSLEPFQKA